MSDTTEEFVSEDCDTSTLNTDDVRREIEQFSAGKKLSDQGTLIHRSNLLFIFF